MGTEDTEDALTVWARGAMEMLAASGLTPFALTHAERCLSASAEGRGAEALDGQLLEAARAKPELLLDAARAMPVDSNLRRGSFAMFVECVHEFGFATAAKYGAYLPRIRDNAGRRFGPEGAEMIIATVGALRVLCEREGLGVVELSLWVEVKAAEGDSLNHLGDVLYEDVVDLRRRGAGAEQTAQALLACRFDPAKAAAVLFDGAAPAVVDGWL